MTPGKKFADLVVNYFRMYDVFFTNRAFMLEVVRPYIQKVGAVHINHLRNQEPRMWYGYLHATLTDEFHHAVATRGLNLINKMEICSADEAARTGIIVIKHNLLLVDITLDISFDTTLLSMYDQDRVYLAADNHLNRAVAAFERN